MQRKHPWTGQPFSAQYQNHRLGVRKRRDVDGKPIEFLLTYEDWIAIWSVNSAILNRGKLRGQFVMARFNDRGHYEVGNVEIITTDENTRRARLAETPERRAERCKTGTRGVRAKKGCRTCR